VNISIKRSVAAVTALLIAVAAAGLASAALASAATTPIDVAGISGATIVADGSTGYTLTVPGLTPDVPYQGAVDTHDTTWRYEASATSDGSGTGTFVFTFAAPPAAGTTVYVTAQPLGDAPNFHVTLTFPALNDTTPVTFPAGDGGHAGATITGTSGAALLVVPGMTPNVYYTLNGTNIRGGPWYATSTSGGLVTFVLSGRPGQKSWGGAGFTDYVESSSAPSTSADGTFVVPAAPPVVVIAPGNDTATAVASGAAITIPAAANDVATTDGTPIPASGLDYSLTSTPALGTATWNGDHSLTYTAASVAGVDTLTYQVCAPATGVCGQATITVTVDPAPVVVVPPVVVIAPGNDTATAVASGAAITIPVAANDVATSDGTPIPASGLSYSLTSTPALGTATWNADHSLTYTAASVAGVDTLTYQVCAPAPGVCGQATITVTVDPAPVVVVPPVVVIAPGDDTANVVAAGQVTIPVAANDVATTDGTPIPASGLDYSLTSTPALGTATWNADHSLTYTAAAMAGVDTLTYQVCSPATRVCGQGRITVTVDPILAKAPAAAPIPQVSRIPRGGVATGDGSTAGQLAALPKTGGGELPSILVSMAALTAGGLMVAGGRKRDDED
jgi:hypothetical protein